MDDRSTSGVAEGFGLMFYNARMYDPYLNQFTQPDTIVPDPYNPQDWNRYAYARNNPIRYNDPSGHRPCGDGERFDCDGSPNVKRKKEWNDYANWARGKSQNPEGWPDQWPVLSGLLLNAATTNNPSEAQKVFLDWWFSNKPTQRTFGPDSQMASELRSSQSFFKGIISAREEYLNSGQTSFKRDAGFTFVGLLNTGLDTFQYALGRQTEPFLGSYNIYINPVDTSDPYYVKITVTNKTGMESGTRLAEHMNTVNGAGDYMFGPYISDENQWAEENGNGYPMLQTIYWYETLSVP